LRQLVAAIFEVDRIDSGVVHTIPTGQQLPPNTYPGRIPRREISIRYFLAERTWSSSLRCATLRRKFLIFIAVWDARQGRVRFILFFKTPLPPIHSSPSELSYVLCFILFVRSPQTISKSAVSQTPPVAQDVELYYCPDRLQWKKEAKA